MGKLTLIYDLIVSYRESDDDNDNDDICKTVADYLSAVLYF